MSIPHLDVLRYNPSDSHISSAPLSDSSDAPAHMLFDSNEVSDHSGTKISSLLIIVLLILAGVTIATLTGDNGILGKANDAKTQTEQAKEDENLKIVLVSTLKVSVLLGEKSINFAN